MFFCVTNSKKWPLLLLPPDLHSIFLEKDTARSRAVPCACKTALLCDRLGDAAEETGRKQPLLKIFLAK